MTQSLLPRVLYVLYCSLAPCSHCCSSLSETCNHRLVRAPLVQRRSPPPQPAPFQQRPVEFRYNPNGVLSWRGSGIRRYQGVNVISDVEKVRIYCDRSGAWMLSNPRGKVVKYPRYPDPRPATI